jgi:hypothetical protein
VLALTVTLCVKTGVAAARLRPIPIKKHGSIRISYARGPHIQHPCGCGEHRAG